MYASSHGVTANVIYDNELDKVLNYSAELFMTRPDVTPIWTLNEIAGRHSAVSMWSAGEFAFRGIKPTYFETFNRTVPWKKRIDDLILLLTRSESQIDFAMFYVEHPDFEEHAHSTQSKQASKRIAYRGEKDKFLRMLLIDQIKMFIATGFGHSERQ